MSFTLKISPHSFRIFLLILLLLHTKTSLAKSTIKLGDEVNTTNQLVSPGGKFTLGFFKIDVTNCTYLGVWYTNDAVPPRRVWVANGNNPVTELDTGILSIDSNTGKLIISSQGTTIVSVSDQGGPSSNMSASLQDTGNFVLVNEVDGQILWQSFDHPTNVLLPGMKLGVNLTNGQTWNLTSWLSDDLPSSGGFTLSWDPIDSSHQSLMIRHRGKPYWSSGDLDNQTFPHIEMLNGPSSAYRYNISYVYNSQERFFIFERIDDVLPMWILTPDGYLEEGDTNLIWSPEFCYGYDSGDGCVVESDLPVCRSNKNSFIEMNGDFHSKTSSSFDSNSSLSLGDCMEICWNDCNCVGFIASNNGTGCLSWSGSNDFVVNDQGTSVSKYVLIITQSKGKKYWKWILIAVVISLAFLSLGLYLSIKKIRLEAERKRRDEYLLELTASDSFKSSNELESTGMKGHDLKIFSFASLVTATNDFSSENKLGEGGFGPVYKGKLGDGREIAIKRLSRSSGQGLEEFKNELILIAKLQHTNLVRVLGCCIHGDEKMLIYEYMPNKSLDFFIFDPNRKALLDWSKRVNIIEGIAQGLLYLHKYSRMRVIHRDLKVSNVLLDEAMNPKISDFGMARIFKKNETEAMTSRVVGTYGYMSPEYAMEGTFSEKSDVFSFGVLVLEIVSGRRNSNFTRLERTLNLIGYAWELWQQGDVLELKDPALGNSCVVNQFLRTVHIGLLCVQENAADRPNMSDVISMLSNENFPLPGPKQPAFFTGRSAHESTSNDRQSKDISINNLTVTVMEAR